MRSSRASSDPADTAKRQTSSKGCMQHNGLTQLFSNIFLSILGDSRSTRIILDVWTWTICLRFQRQAFLFYNQQSCNICSLYRHWKWIPLSQYGCLCHFISSLVHKHTAKWVYYPVCSENPPGLRWSCIPRWYISNPVICVLYGQMSITVLFVNSKCPW